MYTRLHQNVYSLGGLRISCGRISQAASRDLYPTYRMCFIILVVCVRVRCLLGLPAPASAFLEGLTSGIPSRSHMTSTLHLSRSLALSIRKSCTARNWHRAADGQIKEPSTWKYFSISWFIGRWWKSVGACCQSVCWTNVRTCARRLGEWWPAVGFDTWANVVLVVVGSPATSLLCSVQSLWRACVWGLILGERLIDSSLVRSIPSALASLVELTRRLGRNTRHDDFAAWATARLIGQHRALAWTYLFS
jgi:hypothetical protein